MTVNIEDLILQKDRRGISNLREFLPADFCRRAAALLQKHYQRVLIVTGFYLTKHAAPETDGPPGALAIGRAVQELGGQVWYVIEPCLLDGMRTIGVAEEQLRVFPILPAAESRAHAHALAAEVEPSMVISVEHCGQTAQGHYHNSRDEDISALTAKPDSLFALGIPSIGIGDGGNEIGMGNLAAQIPSVPSLPREPSATCVDALVIASISNWGAYGLVAALSELEGKNLLPDVSEERGLMTRLYESGCFDGLQAVPALGVDGFGLEEYLATLAQLHTYSKPLHLHPG